MIALPLARRYVIVHGTYDFSSVQGALANSGLCVCNTLAIVFARMLWVGHKGNPVKPW